MRKSTFQSVGMLIVMGWLCFFVDGRAQQDAGAPPVVYLVSGHKNEITKIDWTQDLTFAGVLLQRQQSDYRLIVELWRPESRVKYVGSRLHRAFDMPMQPNDVIVLGVVSEQRLKAVEALPEIAALKLAPDTRKRSVESGKEPGLVAKGETAAVSPVAPAASPSPAPQLPLVQPMTSSHRITWLVVLAVGIVGLLASWRLLKGGKSGEL